MALVVESWEKITAIENYEAVAGELLFRRIFQINPKATSFFAFSKDKSGTQQPDESIYKSALFQTHAKAVITTVDAAVGLLKTDSMDTLVSVLKGLGSKHAYMNLEQAHYDLVGQALLDILAKAVGESFTEPVKEQWVGVYKVIVQNMMEGSKQAKEEKNNAASQQQQAARDSKAEMEDSMAELKRITAEKVSQALLNYELQALANQEKIQAEVDAELKRVAEFKAKLAAEAKRRELEESKAPQLEQVSEDDSEDNKEEEEGVMDLSHFSHNTDLDASDILYNQRSCAQYVYEKLFALTS